MARKSAVSTEEAREHNVEIPKKGKKMLNAKYFLNAQDSKSLEVCNICSKWDCMSVKVNGILSLWM